MGFIRDANVEEIIDDLSISKTLATIREANAYEGRVTECGGMSIPFVDRLW